MEMIISLITLAGMGYGAYWGLKCMLRAGRFAKREEPLTPNDLKVLEESAARLILDIRATADECVAKVERVLADAEVRISAIQTGQYPLATSAPSKRADFVLPSTPMTVGEMARSAYDMINSQESAAQTTREAGLTTGEMELLKGLSQIGSK